MSTGLVLSTFTDQSSRPVLPGQSLATAAKGAPAVRQPPGVQGDPPRVRLRPRQRRPAVRPPTSVHVDTRVRDSAWNFTATRPRTDASAAGAGFTSRGGVVVTRIRPRPNTWSGPGAPRSSAIASSVWRTSAADGACPARRAAASSTAAAPAASGRVRSKGRRPPQPSPIAKPKSR